MSEPYTPTIEYVREEFTYGAQDVDMDGNVVVSFDEAATGFDRWLAGVKAEALREFADELCGVPDYTATRYDQGRVDQRHYVAAELYERANKIEKEAGL